MSTPLPTTPGDIIKLALKTANVLGVGQTASAEDTNDAFNFLNMMMAQWQRRRYLVYQLISVGVPATGQQSYTVGPGGDIDIDRPSKIEAAFFRQLSGGPLPVDYPFTILRSREDYDRISLKTLNAFPQYLFYDSASPLGRVYPWPIPNDQYEIFITVMAPIQKFETINDPIVLPDEYKAALMWNLTLELYPLYGLPPNETVVKKAAASLKIVEQTNTQLPRLSMPAAVQGRPGTFNIYGDYYVGSGS
jgi:hypothetical protein